MNLWARADLFYRFNFLRMGEPLTRVLLRMMRSGRFYPSGRWVIPNQGRGMVSRRADAAWRMLTEPHRTDIQDIGAVFFEDCRDRYFTQPPEDQDAAGETPAEEPGSDRPQQAALSDAAAKVLRIAELRCAQQAQEADKTDEAPQYTCEGPPLGQSSVSAALDTFANSRTALEMLLQHRACATGAVV